MNDAGHVPVLLEQTMALLSPKSGQVAVDCTAGRGGHSVALARSIGTTGTLVLFDLDRGNLEASSARVAAVEGPPRIVALHNSFDTVGGQMRRQELRVDVMLADLGVSSTHLDDGARGFSFRDDAALDMRLNPEQTPTAASVLASITESDLADLIYEYGEDPFARRIARKLVSARRIEPIENTAQLARLVTEAYGHRARSSRMHPATRTFMALRIAVNDELGALERLLEQVRSAAMDQDAWLKPGARIGIISFHSLEDRRVKQAFAEMERSGLGRRLTRKPAVADRDEQQSNPRSRSAKLRVFEIDN